MSDNERDTRPQRNQQQSDADLYNWSGDGNGNGNGNGNGSSPRPDGQADLYKYDGSGQQSRPNDNTAGGCEDVPAGWHPDYSLSSQSAKDWFAKSQELRKQKLDLDQNGDHVVEHGDSLWTIAQRELHDNGKKGSDAEIVQEIQRIVKLNEGKYPSLKCNTDFIKDGWTLHIEPGGRQGPPRPDDRERCVPGRGDDTEVTPPGYSSAKPRVIVNNVYTENAYFDQRGGVQERPDRCLPNRGDDLYRYSGDRDQRPTNRDNLYAYSGDQNQGQPNRDDLYAYSGDRQPRQYNDTPYNGTGNDGTSFYPGAGSAQDQLYYRCPERNGGSRIVNNVNAENAYFDQRSYDSSPGCRIMQGNPSQSGDDNYYNCNSGRRRTVPVYDSGDGNYDQYPTQGNPQYTDGNGSTDYYTYNGDARGNQTGDYYSDARSQQGVQVDGRYSTYNNPAGADDEFAI
jgi:hypothetical protein